MSILSAVIPINGFDERHIDCKEMIASALDAGCEVVLVVDAPSNDIQESIAENFQPLAHSNLKIILGDYRNPGAARNEGLRMATAEWVTFWDSDDFSFPTQIIKDIIACEDKYSVIVGKFTFKSFTTTNKLVTSMNFSETMNKREDFSKNLGLWRMVFRRDRISTVRFPEISMAEDKVFFASLLVDEKETFFSENLYYSYKIGSIKSLTGSSDSLSDLKLAITILQSKPMPQSIYCKKTIRRLCYTALKRGSYSLKMYALFTLAKNLKD